MNLSQLEPHPESRKEKKRIGKGRGTGHGKTAGRGHNGQNSRSGGGVRPGFEGGQMPLLRRLPKRGFNNKRFQTPYLVLNIADLEKLDGEVTPEILKEKGLIKGKNINLKILGQGDLKKALTVKAHSFTESAKKKIEDAKGKWVLI